MTAAQLAQQAAIGGPSSLDSDRHHEPKHGPGN